MSWLWLWINKFSAILSILSHVTAVLRLCWHALCYYLLSWTSFEIVLKLFSLHHAATGFCQQAPCSSVSLFCTFDYNGEFLSGLPNGASCYLTLWVSHGGLVNLISTSPWWNQQHIKLFQRINSPFTESNLVSRVKWVDRRAKVIQDQKWEGDQGWNAVGQVSAFWTLELLFSCHMFSHPPYPFWQRAAFNPFVGRRGPRQCLVMARPLRPAPPGLRVLA